MRIAEILVLHHSHLDIGYTHSQPILWELQREYIDLALDFLDETADWPAISLPRWTCEVTAPVEKWLATASAFWRSSGVQSIRSSWVTPWRSKAGGLVGKGWVGEYHSPGTSPLITFFWRIGQIGSPVSRFST